MRNAVNLYNIILFIYISPAVIFFCCNKTTIYQEDKKRHKDCYYDNDTAVTIYDIMQILFFGHLC